MPSSATITTFNVFTAGTLIRSSAVNTNFNLFRGHLIPIDPNTATAASTLTYDLGSADYSWNNVYQGISVYSGQSTPSNPSTGKYKVYFKSSDGLPYYLNPAGVENPFGSGGGGGGGITVTWQERANSPYFADNVAPLYAFDNGLAQELYCTINVPSSYLTGNPIGLYAKILSSDVSGTVQFKLNATLVRTGTDLLTSTTNTATSGNTAITMTTATADKPIAVNFTITGNGIINSVTISAGDLIKLRIYRDTDTAAGQAYLLLGSEEVYIS